MQILFGFLIISVIQFSWEQSLTMDPDLRTYWLLEGSKLNLNCTYRGSDDVTSMEFTRNPAMSYQDFVVISKANINAVSMILTKENMDLNDGGTFTCRMDVPGRVMEYAIEVHVFKVIVQNRTVVKSGMRAVNVSCRAENIPAETKVKWVKDNVSLEENDKYMMHNDVSLHTLEIKSPGRNDVGTYRCAFVFIPSQEVRSDAIVLYGSFSSDKPGFTADILLLTLSVICATAFTNLSF